MITVHLIGNAHLDPVWLWRWPAGIGEALATCRSAADRIEETPEFIFTRSDQWLYEQIEVLDPALFERIEHYVRLGQWQIVGGWYIQPDCNLPLADSFRKHMELGKAYFQDKFGVEITVGYNVDSFGHNAMLPSFLAESGYDSYVMMRPMEHEKALPAALFRWQAPDGAEVLVWRIPRAYTCWETDLTESIQASLAVADPDIGHVMCFYGVGDHGGGPTKQQIAWLLEHQESFENAKLVFSHPRAFFAAVKPFQQALPVVQDELQFHAVGCYSVVHDLKTQMRRAEHTLIRAKVAQDMFPDDVPTHMDDQLEAAWKKVLFNQFHDIYAGTSLAQSYVDAQDQLGTACDTADTIMYHTLFRSMRELPEDEQQRIVVFNPSDTPYSGYLEHEPWLGWGSFDGWLACNKGDLVPHQMVLHDSVALSEKRKVLWRAEIPAQSWKVYCLCSGEPPISNPTDLQTSSDTISNSHWCLTAGQGESLLGVTRVRDGTSLLSEEGLRIVVQQDSSDTWSHGIDGFRETIAGCFQVTDTQVEEEGPIRALLRVRARFDASNLDLWAALYRDDPRIDLRLLFDWHQSLQISKLCVHLPRTIIARSDGIPGSTLLRPQNGQEFPIHDVTSINTEDGGILSIATPDCFGIDGTDNTVRLTLLRSPAYAWHDPAKLDPDATYRYTDQGEHLFRFCLVEDSIELASDLALGMHRAPVCLDWTKGMIGIKDGSKV